MAARWPWPSSGGLFGELGLADRGPRSTDAETLDDCQLLLIPAAALQAICAGAPTAAQTLTSSIRATLRRPYRRQGRPDLPRRVATELLSQPRHANGIYPAHTMSQEKMAHQADGIRQIVTRRCAASSGAAGSNCTTGPSRSGRSGPWPDSTALTCRQADSSPVGQLTARRVVI